MNIHAQRLLNVARATRETAAPGDFTMRYFGDCGSPACALGNYAVRRDLQRVFYLGKLPEDGTRLFLRSVADNSLVSFSEGLVQRHFGISEAEAVELFSGVGCGYAKTPEAAALYIEAFVARKWPAQTPDWERMAAVTERSV